MTDTSDDASGRIVPAVRVYFDISGSFDPASLTERLGVQPSTTWREGAPIGRSKLLRESDGWSLRIGPEETWDVSPFLAELVRNLAGKAEILESIRSEGNGTEIGIEIRIPPDSSAPGISLESAVLKELGRLGIDLDIDILGS